jgi:precorrin-3B C17-methyltransferase
MSQRAAEVLAECDMVAGYTKYIDLIRDLIPNKQIISTGMTREVDRVESAIQTSLQGNSCAIVSSGDPGIYAMAGLVFEICREKEIPLVSHRIDTGTAGLLVEVVPGIPALSSGAALLGAPLMHDFAAISLSDLLTPWETIEKRLQAAARADFVIVIYNPKSKKRDWQLDKARQIALEHRPGQTPVGIVTDAMRENESVVITTLADLNKAEVDMLTTVFIGNSNTFTHDGFMITPRGYADKYDLK